MRVDNASKRGAHRGRGRQQNRTRLQTDLVVTVPNENGEFASDKSSMATTSQSSRTIVRLNAKTESTGLEKVTIKSLDEIKREKEKRLKESTTSQNSSSAQSKSGEGADPAKQRSGSGDPRLAAAPQRTAIATSAEPTSSSSVENPSMASSKMMLKELTIPLRALPTSPLTRAKATHNLAMSNSTSLTRPTEAGDSSLDSSLSEQDFEGDEDEHNTGDSDELDEEFLLRDDEEIGNATRLHGCNQNHQDTEEAGGSEQGAAFMDYSSVPLGLGYDEEEEGETISIHADDTMFEEEDEFSVTNDRLRPRLFGRKSTNDSTDLRTFLSDRQQNWQGEGNSSNKSENTPKDTQEVEGGAKLESKPNGEGMENGEESGHDENENVSVGKSENLSSRSSHPRGESDRTPPKCLHTEDRHNVRGFNKQGAKRNSRRQFNTGFTGRGGLGARRGQGRGTGRNRGGLGLRIPPLGSGKGLLELPGSTSGMIAPAALTTLQAMHAALQAGIQNNIKTTLEMLTNPPPVPGEKVADEFLKPGNVPLLKHKFQGTGEKAHADEHRPARRAALSGRHSNTSGKIRPLGPDFTLPKHSRKENRDNSSRRLETSPPKQQGQSEKAIPQWLKRSLDNQSVKQDVMVESGHQRQSTIFEDMDVHDSNHLVGGEQVVNQELHFQGSDVKENLNIDAATGAMEFIVSKQNEFTTPDNSLQSSKREDLKVKDQWESRSNEQGGDAGAVEVSQVEGDSRVQWVSASVESRAQISPNRPAWQTSASETATEMPCSSVKRKSPFHGEVTEHVDKVQVGTSPEGLPKASPVKEPISLPFGICWNHLKKGGCTYRGCKYRHLSPAELIEFRESQQLARNLRQENPQQAQQNHQPAQQNHPLAQQFHHPTQQIHQPTQQIHQPAQQIHQPAQQIHQPAQQIHQPNYQPTQQNHQPDPVVMQQEGNTEEIKKIPEVSFESVIGHLNNKNLGTAWQQIERLQRMNNIIGLPILERTLVLCSEHLDEPDTVAQVACKAFDMIGRVRVRHNRHDYTILIKTLCNSGQFIRAYEMLAVMKKNSLAPTYDLYLDLVKASEKDPNWAFNLLDDIKAAGLFMTDICTDLILLGCRSGEHFVDRTWLLFQEALQSQVSKPKPTAVSTMLLTLAHSNKWEDSMLVIQSCPEAVPVEFLKAAMLSGFHKTEWYEAIIMVLSVTSAEKLGELSVEVWNAFLSNCCLQHVTDVSSAQKIYSVMQQSSVPLTAECANSYMSALSQANQWSAALELFTNICTDPQVLEQPQTLTVGLLALTSALNKAEAAAGMLTVVHFMLENLIKPDDDVLMSSVENLDREKNFKGVHQFFFQLQTAGFAPPLAVYRLIVSSLEKWAENPSASLEAYAALRKAYPVLQTKSSNPGTVTKESPKQEQPRQTVCRYIDTVTGCMRNNCRFLHPLGSVSKQEETTSLSGGSISGGSTTGSQIGKRPIKPFVLQTHEVQPMGIPSTKQSGQHFNENQMADSGTEPSPFVLQNTSVGITGMPFIQSVKPEVAQEMPYTGPEGYNVASSSERPFGSRVCWFYSTPQGCYKGSNCRFAHPPRDISVPENPNQVSAESMFGGNGGAIGNRPLPANPFVFKDPVLTSNGGLASGPFGSIQNQQHISPSSSLNATSLESKVPFSSALGGPFQHLFVKGQPEHFQLAGVSNFKGQRNPFSPVLPERTHSLDELHSRAPVAENHQAQSAPVVSERPGDSYFHFPTKKNIQFYFPRIKHASQENNWEALGYVYMSMKNEDMAIDDSVLQVFHEAFVSNCPNTAGDCFGKFVNKVHHLLDSNRPNPEPDQSPSASFDEEDKAFIGQLGVAFMYYCHSKENFHQGYSVLHTLHDSSINYSLYNGGFGLHQISLSATQVALTAADICLKLDEPLYSSALEVLRGTSYALPVGGTLTAVEAEQRRSVLQMLCRHFMSEKNFDVTDELLTNIGDHNMFGNGELGALYNEFLITLVQSSELDKAMDLLSVMESNFISRDPESIRALVNGLGEAGLITQAKKHFLSGYLSGVYPSFDRDTPRTVTVGTSFSALECQFCIEKHLQLLHQFIEEEPVVTGNQGMSDSYCRSLRVVVKSDEAPRLYSGYMAREEIIRCVRDMVVTVLSEDFNPPLACDETNKDEEVVVNALSLKRWFCANPTRRRFNSGRVALGRSVSSVDPTSTNAHPYLQPGMSNVIVSSVSDESEGRRVSVLLDTDGQSPQGECSESGQMLQPLSKKNVRDRVAHVICSRLTGYLRQGKIENKTKIKHGKNEQFLQKHPESFRQWARKLTQLYLRTEDFSVIQQNYEEGKERIYQFVDEYFKENRDSPF